MKRIAYSLLITGLLGSAAFGQAVKLSDKPDQFVADVQKLMATGGPASARAGTDLQALWSENRLSAAQQERVMALSRKMNQRRLAPAQYYAPFYEAVYHTIHTQNSTDVDGLLTVAEKLFDAGDMKAYARGLETVRLFTERRQLYDSKYNKLYTQGGTFKFRYVDGAPATPTDIKTPADSLAAVKAAAERSRFDGWDDPIAGDSTQPRPVGVQFVPQRRPIPVVSGVVITLTGASLAIVANGDSAVLANTNGDVLLKDGVLVGKGGRFGWETADLPNTYVTLSDYSMILANPKLLADDVALTYPPGGSASAKPIKGVFEYVSRKKGGPATYPRFMSWQNDVRIPNLGKDVEYRGGLALAGAQLTGASASGQPAVLIVRQNGKPAFKALSRRFEFRDSLITANATQFIGYVEKDSLTHPAVKFRFDKTQRIAWLDRETRTDYARVPYTDTYHKFYIQPEVVRWDLNRKKVDFYQVGAKREVPVRFESFDYFLPQRYADLTVDYGFHPLQIVANYVATKKQQTFTDDDITNFAKVNAGALRGALSRMVLEGYLDRDASTGLMRLSRKGILYVLAYANKRDYDNFQVQSLFSSNDSTKNATLNLNDNILTIRGVNRFIISDSLKILGLPSDKTLRVGKGRSFSINGQLKAGTLRYAGRNLDFDYDKFAMNLNQIDSITFSSAKLAAQGKDGEVGGDIKYDNPGTVYFGAADNKSGQVKGKKTTQRLVMPKGMTVYFDQPVRGDKVYNRKVYFKIPAIDNDSIGQGDLVFVGTFYSDGMLPPFKAELKTMPDNTLGFVHKAPATGYAVYGGKPGPGGSNVKFTSDLIMDKTGLHTEGVLNHLTTTLTAQEMRFMPDSLVASGVKGEMREGLVDGGKPGAAPTYFPQVQLNNYTLHWRPKVDSMVITTQKNNFNFYNATTNLEGSLVLRSSGLFGNGTLRRKDSETVSPSIKFNKDGFLADNANFRVVSDKEAGKPILLGSDIDVDFNQVKGIVGIAMNKKQSVDDTLSSSVEFPFAAYKTNINRAQWNINAKTIAMKGDVKTSTFTATGEEQEGLTFNGSAALYDVDKMVLNISGVPAITSADARILPDKGLVTIKRNGEMLPLKNARLELDTISHFHRLKNGNIQIVSRTRFAGDATYQFATVKGDTANIKMGQFELKEAPAVASNQLTADTKKPSRGRSGKNAGLKPVTTYFTVARAEVDEGDNLQLAPRMMYKGTITMQAPDKDLALDGFIRPALKKRATLESGWIPFREKVAESIAIKVDKNLKNEGRQPLVAGIHARAGGAGLYATFLSPKEDAKDDDLFAATGEMRYDEKAKVFRISSSAAAVEASDSTDAADSTADVGNAFTFNDPRGIMTFKGKLNLLQSAPNAYLLASGSARVNIDSSLYRLNTLLAFTFPVPDPINTAVANKLVETNGEEKNDQAADDDLNRLSDKLLPLIGQPAVDAYRTKAQNQHVPLSQASPKLNAMLVLANANLRWSEKFNAFYSTGRLGVSNIGATDINAQMDGFIELRKSANGDEASLYLEASPDVWVYYDYKPGSTPTARGQLAIITSEQDINDKLLASSKNSAKAALEVVPATVDEKSLFVDRYLDQYKTRPKSAPRPKKEVRKEEPVATAAEDITAEEPAAEEAPAAPAAPVKKGKTKGTKTKPGAATAAAPATAKPTDAKPAPKVAKEEPKKVEKKKDKEDEKEGF